MRWQGPLAVLVYAAAATSAAAKDAPFPPGPSTQTFGPRTFDLVVPEGDLVVPEGAAPERGYSLLLAIDSDGKSLAGELGALAKDGFVVCSPAKVHPGGGWATSEAKDILDLIDHIESGLPAGKAGKVRLHVLTNESWGFASFVAFDKRVQTASLTLAQVYTYRGKSPPDAAKKQMAVLSLWQGEPRGGFDGHDVLKTLAGKVRTLEWRHGLTSDPYFRYWLLVADDRFTPGFDLSFPWVEEEKTAPTAKPGAKPSAPPEATLDAAKRQAGGTRGVLAYFWSASDANKAEAKAIQNDLFFRPDVRETAAGLVAAKLEREKNEAAFASLGLKTTPAVVVLDSAFATVQAFEGAIDPKAFVAALRKAAPPAPKTK